MDQEPPETSPPADTDGTGAAAASDLDHEIDLDAIERDLAGVEVALVRLDDGTYWTCEVTGADLPADLLRGDPTARRRPGVPAPAAEG
jgi:RNA polymerase-binding transcription factor DksA